jgi:hypothetical protein
MFVYQRSTNGVSKIHNMSFLPRFCEIYASAINVSTTAVTKAVTVFIGDSADLEALVKFVNRCSYQFIFTDKVAGQVHRVKYSGDVQTVVIYVCKNEDGSYESTLTSDAADSLFALFDACSTSVSKKDSVEVETCDLAYFYDLAFNLGICI